MAEDRRIRYTKAALKQSLLDLLHQKPLAKVSVKELCELADVNRGTFYAHYKSPEELMASIENEYMAGLLEHMKDSGRSTSEEEKMVTIEKVLEYMLANKSLCLIILSCNEGNPYLVDAVASLYDQFAPIWLGRLSGTPEGDAIFSFIMHGSIGLIKDWLMSKNPLSIKAMATLITDITHRGLSTMNL